MDVQTHSQIYYAVSASKWVTVIRLKAEKYKQYMKHSHKVHLALNTDHYISLPAPNQAKLRSLSTIEQGAKPQVQYYLSFLSWAWPWVWYTEIIPQRVFSINLNDY